MMNRVFSFLDKDKEDEVKLGQVRRDARNRVIIVMQFDEIERESPTPPYRTLYKALCVRTGDSHGDGMLPFKTVPYNYESLEELGRDYPILLDAELTVGGR